MKLTRSALLWGLLTLLAICAFMAMAGHPLIPAEAFASLGVLPLAIGNTEHSISEMLNQMHDGLEGFKKRKDEEIRELLTRLDRMETRMARPGAGAAAVVGPDSATKGIAQPSETERKAFREYLRTGKAEFAQEGKASINVSTPGQGMEAVDPWFDGMVRSLARDQTPLLKRIGMRRAENFPAKAVVTDSSAMGSGWAGELSSRTDTDPPVPRVVEIQAGEWYAIPTITEWALEDMSFQAESWLAYELRMEYSQSVMSAVVSGNGTNKPTGFLNGTPVATADALRAFGTLQYIASGQAAALPATASATVDLLLDVMHSLKWQHRQKACWVMNVSTMSALRKLKDADGRPLLLDSLTASAPPKLIGYDVVECEAMPSIGANALPIAFGDFNAGYALYEDRKSMRITRDDVTTPGFVKFYTRARIGGKVVDSEAIKLVKVAAS